MKLDLAKGLIIAREERARAILAEAKAKAEKGEVAEDPDVDVDEDDDGEWDDDDQENALKLIRDMSFQLKDMGRLASLHPHRRTTIDNLVNDAMQFLCMFEEEEEEADICTHCNAVPFGGACDGSCMDYSG